MNNKYYKNCITLFIFNSNSSVAFFSISESMDNVPSISSVSNAPMSVSLYTETN